MRVVARMTSDGQPSNSYDYLRTLRPEARAMQAAELERGVLAGEESPRNALILQELRRTIPRAPPPAARMGEVARMFLRRSSVRHRRCGGSQVLAHCAGIARALVGWIGRDLMPAETKAPRADIERTLRTNDRVKAEQRTAHCTIAPFFAPARRWRR